MEPRIAPDHDRVARRAAEALPEEAGTADPEALAEALLSDSDSRQEREGDYVEHRRSEEVADL